MATVTITPLFTDAGLAAIANAQGNGLSAVISEIAIGDSGYTPGASATALDNELVRVNCSAGGAVADTEVLVEAQVPAGSPEFFIKEIGFFLDDGTLLAIWSDPSANIGYRSSLAPWFFKFVLGWTDFPAGAITVNFNGDAATAANALDISQLEAKVRHTVESAGITWDDAINSQLTEAIEAYIDGALSDAEFIAALAAYLAANGYLRRDVADTLTAGFFSTPVALTASADVATPDFAEGNVLYLESVAAGGVITANTTLEVPASMPAGGMAIIYVTQDGTGGHALNFAAGYKIQSGSLATDPGAVNILYLTFDGSSVIDVAISQRGE